MAITKEQFMAYERVRQSGVTNMFDVRTVQMLSGLSKENIVEIMDTYSVLKDKYMASEIRLTAKNIEVDSGTILITDKGNFQIEPSFVPASVVFDVPLGKYDVEWHMPDTYNGDVSGQGELTIKTGKMIVIDPCYLHELSQPHEKWLALLKRTKYFKHPPENWIILDKHGGDGSFIVHIVLRRI